MHAVLVLLALLLTPSFAFAQAGQPPFEVRTNDGATSCLPAYVMAVNDGSLSCGTVAGKPGAIVNMGTPTATTPWSQVTAGANANTLTIGAGGSLGTSGGVINYNAGTVNLTTLTHTGVSAASQMYMSSAAGTMAVVNMLSCNAATEKLRWTGTVWECVTDQGGVTSGQVLVTSSDTTVGYLDDKLITGNGLSKSVQNPGANETLRWDVDLLNTVVAGPTTSASGLAFVGVELSLLACAANESLRKNGANTGWECYTPGVGGSSNWADLVPGNLSTAGVFQMSGGANLRIDSQLRIPTSTTAPLVDNELKIDTDADGSILNKPALAFRSGAANFYVPNPTALPTADGDVLTYQAASLGYVWAQPPGAGTGNPGGATNSVQYNAGASTFGGSTRCSIDPTTQAMVCTCNRGTSGDCADTKTSEAGAVAAPPGTDDANVYIKKTGTVYDLCWHGNGDTGERCSGGTAINAPKEIVRWDMAGLSTDGSSATSNWDYDTGTLTANVENANAIKYASLSFAAAGTSCVQRKFAFDSKTDLSGNLDAVVRWKSDATSGSATFTAQAACWDGGAESAVAFIGTPISVVSSTNGAGFRNGATFLNIDKTGCTTSSIVVLRLCQTANALTGGTENLARAFQFQYEHIRIFPP